MKQFHALPKFGPQQCPSIYISHGSVLFLPELNSKQNLLSNSVFEIFKQYFWKISVIKKLLSNSAFEKLAREV